MNDLRRGRSVWVAWCLAISSLLLGCQVLFGGVDVGEAPGPLPGPESCTPGEYRCNGEYLLSCGSQDAGWKREEVCATAERCDPKGKQCLVCTNGDFRCKGATRQSCLPDGSDWKDFQECPTAELCSETSCEPCTPGALDCGGEDRRLLRECSAAGTWVVLDTCENDLLCLESKVTAASVGVSWSKSCNEPGCDQPAMYRCEGMRLQHCPPARTDWREVDVCSTGAVCEVTASEANSSDVDSSGTVFMCIEGCQPAGAVVCDGMKLTQCRSNQTGYDVVETCPSGTECNPVQKLCGPVCTPGDHQCNGTVLRQCQADRTWLDLDDCRSTALCVVAEDERSGECKPYPCEPNEYDCENGALRKCRDDLTGWEIQETCGSPALCNKTSMRCDIGCPMANALRCTGQLLERCKADLTAWETVDTCPQGQLCNTDPAGPACLTDCPAATRCNGRALESCTNAGGWQATATCATEELCTCTLDPDGTGPLTHSCLAGIFRDGCGIVECGGVLTGFRCQGAQLQQCQPGRNGWGTISTCSSANNCLASDFSGYCAECPAPGELECNGTAPGSTLRVCSADRRTWNTSATCSQYGCVQVTGGPDFCAACNVGDAQCAGATLQQCAGDRSGLTSQTCLSATLCDQAGRQCDVCVANDAECTADNTLRTCSNNGQSVQTQRCPDLCDAPNRRCITCTPGDRWCVDAVLHTCTADGLRSTTEACATTTLCDGDAGLCRPPTCDVGETECNGAQPRICNSGRDDWVDSRAACATTALCVSETGMCTPPTCAVGERDCEGNQPVICNADRDDFRSDGSPCELDCLEGGICSTCTAGDGRCAGSQPEVCNAAGTAWTPLGRACPTGAPCTEPNGVCDWACSIGQAQCLNGARETCNDDRTAFVEDPCPSGQYCTGAGICVRQECMPNVTGCDGRQPQRCAADGSQWNPVGGPCDSPALCNPSSASCNVCVAGEQQCLGDNLETCEGTPLAWVLTEACGAGLCDAMAFECDECVMGVQECVDDASFRQCDNQGHWGTAVACPPELPTCDLDMDTCVAAVDP